MKRFWHWFRQPISFFEALELLLTVAILVLIWFEFQGGNNQIVILNSLASDVAVQGQALNNLTTTNSKLLSSMRRANDNFQSSLKVTKKMGNAMRKQLEILAAEQRARETQAAEKPVVVLRADGQPFLARRKTLMRMRKITSTTATFDLFVVNIGSSSLENGTLYIELLTPNVSLTCVEDCTEVPQIPQITRPTYAVPLGRRVGIGVSEIITMTLHFAKNRRQSVDIWFSVEGDNYPRTNLAIGTVPPA